MNQLLEKLNHISSIPKHGTDEYKRWLEQEEFLKFLLDTSRGEIPLYVSYKGAFINSIFLPQNRLKGKYIDDLMKWEDCNPGRTWGYGYSPRTISSPFDFSGSKLLRSATPITILRSFEGRIGTEKSYIVANQLLTHPNDLHYENERSAYCRLNEDGDVEEVIKVRHKPGEKLVTITQDILDKHLFLTNSVLVRFFDRNLCNDWMGFVERGGRKETKIQDKRNKIYARQVIAFDKDNLPTAGALRGFQIVNNRLSSGEKRKLLTSASRPKKYEKFIARDWKNNRTASFSCDPQKLGNYFEKSDKPYETSPVFFKPDVLLKYKQNPEKYTLEQRSISCRNSWSLKTYDINKAGQVHTYLCYLGHLPHSEQLYWKSFNEKPKGNISRRAFKTDFFGKRDLSYEPLSSLKKNLRGLGQTKNELWRCTDAKLYQQLNYPVADNLKEWTDEIHTLDKLVVEGFKKPYLKSIAEALNCHADKLGSIKLLKKILEAKGFDDQEVSEIISPLDEIHNLRTKFSGHSSGSEAVTKRKKLIEEHGDLRRHFRSLVERTDISIKFLVSTTF